jgi:glycerol uptake facilitator-like aquaporin
MAEMCGTGLLLLIGLSSVIFMFAESSPFVALVPSLTLRRIINGFFFGSVGATMALSPIGRISGAHINPIATMGFGWSENSPVDPRSDMSSRNSAAPYSAVCHCCFGDRWVAAFIMA